MKTLMTRLLILLLGTVMLMPAMAADKGTIRIGLNNWAENVAVSHLWKILLEEHGYDVKLTNAGKAVIYSGIAKDSLDIGFEVWMPKTDKHYYERYKKDISLNNAWYHGTGLGLVVPSYVDIDSIEQLNAHRQEFKQEGQPTIIGIDPGSSLVGLTEKAIKTYNLHFNLRTSSGPGMTSALTRAYKHEKPIVVTLWNPHWAFARFDLKYLDDPKNIYGKGENIRWMSRPELLDEHPQVVAWINSFEMTHQQLASLMGTIKKIGDPATGARQWLGQHQTLVKSWFKG